MATIHDKMTAIGNAIRAKTGGTELLTLDKMAIEIANISTGTELNFSVVGGTAEPVNPKENTIWIETNIEITGWIIDLTTPTNPTEGVVWIKNDPSISLKFNALKENGIQVHPISTKQYVNGTWVDKINNIYQNGTWRDSLYYIFKSGTGFTSSINSFSTSGDNDSSGSKVTANTTQITATLVALEATTSFQSQQTVDVSNFKTMVFTGVTARWGPSQSAHHAIALNVSGAGSASVTIGSGNVDQYPDLVMCNNATFTIDVSNISGNVYIGGYYSSSRMDVSNTGTIIIQNIYLK